MFAPRSSAACLSARAPSNSPMAPVAAELNQIGSSLFIWQAYDPPAKSDLFSTALVTAAGTFVIDPIALQPPEFARLRKRGHVAGVVVTNANHERAAMSYSGKLSVPIFATADAFSHAKPEHFVELQDGDRIENEIVVIEIPGAVAGEVALYHEGDGGTLIIGDALINFEPYGFTFLPTKYCRDQRQMRRSLRKLLDREARRMFFAHGLPILSDAGMRLRQLLDISS